jgi:hypothetical protein
MLIPLLRSIANPAAPRWAPVRISAEEARPISRAVIMLVAFNDCTGEPEVLGSGFMIATQPELVALTATHVITEWVDKVRPPAAHAFRGLHGDVDDLLRRIDDVVQKHLIRAVVRCRSQGGYRLCKLAALTLPPDPWDIDVACLRFRLPGWTTHPDFDALPIDADPHPFGTPVMMAGWVSGSWTLPEYEDHPFNVNQELDVRAAFNLGPVTSPPPRFKGDMYPIDAPSEPGMSGGPLLAVRREHGSQRLILTAKGVISRDRIAPAKTAADEANPNETWVSPIEHALLMRYPVLPPQSGWLLDAVRAGSIRSYGQRVFSARLELLDNNMIRLHWV